MASLSTNEISIGDTAARATAFPPPDDGSHPTAKDIGDENGMSLNMGPSHPATHGVLRLRLDLDGDIVTRCTPVIGYLHRGIEKLAENMTYNQFVTCTDRLDYLAPLSNNVAFSIAVEKLARIEVPPRCQAIRVICCELARLSSHLLGLGVYGMDTGAWTVFMYAFTEREKLHTLFEELTGARFTTAYTRVGGVARDIPDGWLARVEKFCDELPRAIDEIDTLLTRNTIFLDRTQGIAPVSKETALAYSLTGANLRASGVPADLRKDHPYSGYENYDFDIPVGTKGDCYDRYLVRMEELRQSLRIVKQAAAKMPGGAWCVEESAKIFPPPKGKVLTDMEALIQNFVLTTQGPPIPAGEVYFEAENPKGALGFFIHSKGGGVPWRLRIRGGSFFSLGILPRIVPGHYLTDIPAILGSLDFVMGECDR
jgi:NADH-quinone oxidoreductase subunit D